MKEMPINFYQKIESQQNLTQRLFQNQKAKTKDSFTS